jgi:Ca-activated chloride channel homolog
MEHPVKHALHALLAGLVVGVGVFASAGAVPQRAGRPAQTAGAGQGERVTPPVSVPTITLPSGESSAQLTRMEVRVTVSGLEAETVTTMTFRNPNGRQLAGDFEFPMPDDAVVAGYALDVAGRMVDGVLVTRQKARVVLETETRRRVDPGIVEHVRGNMFRTRIFPLPARGERTVRVVTVGSLALSGGDAACRVPLPRMAIPSLSLHVEVVKGAVRPQLGGFGNLSLAEWTDRWVAETTMTSVTPGDDLQVRLPRLPALLVAVERAEDERYVAISHAPSATAAGAGSAVARAAVAWDASGSRDGAAVKRDRALLAALLATPAWRQATIDLVVFRDRREAPRSFAVHDGTSPELFAHLDSLPYDGGTDLSALDFRKGSAPNAGDAAWLLFTDGLFTLGAGLPPVGGLPVHVVASDGVRDAAIQRRLSSTTGGTLVDLTTVEPEAGGRMIADPPLALLRVDDPSGALAEVQARFAPGSGRATVYAKLQHAGQATLVYGAAGRELARVPITLPADGPGGRIVARAWAARKVEDLSVLPEQNEAAMVAVGRRFGLVTPATSLIVLESVQQYVEHDIEPPASWPEMRQQYAAALEARKGAERRKQDSKIERVVGWWQQRVAWWEREFHYGKEFKWAEAPAQAGRADARSRDEATRQSMAEAVPPPPAAAPAQAAGNFGAGAGESRTGVARMAMKAESSATESVAAGITIKAWSPDTPYLKAIKAVPAAQAYAAYLRERASYAASPSFYLDCAGAILPVDKALGLRVLSNLAELKIDDAALLRVFAWRLGEAGELDRAVETLERVRALRPEDPQSHRDLALVLADRMDRDRRPADGLRAARLLYDVVVGEWQRFEEVEVVALMELNRLVARLERLDPAAAARVTYVDERVRRLLDVDVRIVMSWDADNTDIDLHVIEPSGEEAFYGHNTTTIGGHVSRDFTQGYGPEEYVLRRAMGGVYAIKCKYYGSRQQTLVGPATVTATVITNFGRPDERRQVLTLRLESVKDMVEIGKVTIESRN